MRRFHKIAILAAAVVLAVTLAPRLYKFISYMTREKVVSHSRLGKGGEPCLHTLGGQRLIFPWTRLANFSEADRQRRHYKHSLDLILCLKDGSLVITKESVIDASWDEIRKCG